MSVEFFGLVDGYSCSDAAGEYIAFYMGTVRPV